MSLAAYPNPARTTRLDSYLALLQAGFALPGLLPEACGALLPHPFTLTTQKMCGGILSVALSGGSRPPGVTWRLVLWSPDFPLTHNPASDCLTDSLTSVLPLIREDQSSFINKRPSLTRYS